MKLNESEETEEASLIQNTVKTSCLYSAIIISSFVQKYFKGTGGDFLLILFQQGCFHPFALTFKHKQVAVMEQSIQKGTCHLFIEQNMGPSGKLNIGSNDDLVVMMMLFF